MNDIPYSQEAEEAVLGALLIAPKLFPNVAAFLKVDDFFFLRCSYVFAAMQRLSRHDPPIPIDPVTMSEDLQAHGQLAEIGGPAYLTQLIRNTPTSVHAEVYGGIVRTQAMRRQLIQVSDEIKVLACDQTQSVAVVCSEVERKTLDVTGQGRPKVEPTLNETVNEYWDGLEARIDAVREGKNIFIPTGLWKYDEHFGGSYPGEVLVIGGPAKMGKTTFVLSIARNRALLNIHQAIFSTEMTRGEIIQKWLAMETGIPVMTLKAGCLSAKQIKATTIALSDIAQWPVSIFADYFPLTPLDIQRELRRLEQNNPAQLCLIDGLWMMKHHTKIKERHQEIAEIMNHLTRLSKRFKIPIDLVHQMKRAVEDRKNKEPRMSDFAGSAAVERYANTCIGLYREDLYDKEAFPNFVAYVMANRTGKTSGKVSLSFDKTHELYQDPPTTPVQPPLGGYIPAHEDRGYPTQ